MTAPESMTPLRVLLIEDSIDDAELIVRTLRALDVGLEYQRVDRESDLRAALAEATWDLAVSDYVLPGFSGPAAVAVVRELRPGLPVIVVSGTVGEDIAVEAVRSGAHDYVMKSNLDRLPYAAERALHDVAAGRLRAAEQAALVAAERRFDGVLDAVPTAIIVVDQEGRIVRVNRHVSQVFGYPSDEVVGLPVDLLLAPELRARHHADRAAYLAAPEPRMMGKGREVDGLRKDGSSVRLEVGLAPLTTGEETLIVAAAHDISSRLELEARLHQAEKMEALGRLAGGIAHDFNNLLTAINGYADLVAMELPDASPLRSEVAQIRSAGERGAELVRYLLAFGRRQPLRPQAIDLGNVLADLEPLLRRLATEAVDVRIRIEDGTPLIHCDRSQLEQSIVNLVVNARDAMPAGGAVTIAARAGDAADGSFAVIEVSDAGTGIANDILGQIFTPFFTTKPPGRGSGLGLASVHGFVVQSGGSIDVGNTAGSGARFVIRLPTAATDVGSPPKPRAIADEVRGLGQTILVVEDEPAVRSIIEATLVRFGYHAVMASGPADVERALAGAVTPPAAMVTDIVMPGLDGRTLAQRMRTRYPRIGVVLISGYDPDAGGTDDGLLAARIPGSLFVAKPFDPAELAAAVSEVLAKPVADRGRSSG